MRVALIVLLSQHGFALVATQTWSVRVPCNFTWPKSSEAPPKPLHAHVMLTCQDSAYWCTRLCRYGADCSRLALLARTSPARSAPWLQRHARSPVLDHAVTGKPKTRLRPLIYVYDIDTLYTSKLLQWRHIKHACVARFYSKCAAACSGPAAASYSSAAS
jgi:hypothetical protein